ncbi:MAG: MG2 domain-containing protein [Bacteroidia bacterium]
MDTVRGGLSELNIDAKSYERDWEKVADFESKSWYQSADRVVTKIQKRAKQNQNAFQEARAIVTHMRLQPKFGVDWEANMERDLREAIPRWEFPYTQLGHSILGQFYWNHAQSNLWRLEGTANVPDDTSDFRAWGMQRLAIEADRHFQASLMDPKKLRKIGLKAFGSIMLRWNEGEEYRPSMLDLLAWRAVEFYEDPMANATQARPATIGKLEAAFSDAKTFMNTQFPTSDSTNFRYKAILIYQLLTQYHIKDRHPESQLLLDIERMKSAQATFPSVNGDSLRIDFLSKRMEEMIGENGQGYCAAEIAKIYLSHSDTLVMPRDTRNLNNHQRALGVLNRATTDLHEELPGFTLCFNMAEEIRKKEFHVWVGSNLLPGKTSLLSIAYKNLDSCWIRVVRLDSAYHERFWWRDREKKESLLHLPYQKEWMVNLPDASDGITHHVATALPPLEQGDYAILVRASPDFSTDEELDGIGFVQVNQLSLWTSTSPDRAMEAFVMDRNSGRPVSGAEVDLWKYRTESGSNTKLVPIGNWLSDHQGYFKVPKDTVVSTYYGRIVHGKDTLRIEDDPDYDYTPEIEKEHTRAHIFTDRAIYRPQQTVYFKGIVMVQGGGKPEHLVTNSNRFIFLKDANDDVVDSLRVRTNDFGSYAGSFKLPTGRLGGQFTISDGTSQHYFSVEEYKRPQFEVELDTVQGSHRIGEMIDIKGRGKSYAGANLTDAEVSYIVERSVFWPWRYCFWDPYNDFSYSGGRSVVAHGKIKPDSLGNFHVRFLASPDPEQDFRRQPTYQYRVEVTVTDATGESHSNSMSTTLGYRSLGLDLGLPDEIDKDSFKGFKATTKNLNDQPVPTQGKVKVYRLAGPSQMWIPHDMTVPDQFLMSRDSFRRLFPHIEYDKADREGDYKRVKTVADLSFDTGKSGEIQFPELKAWEQGWYEVEGICKDAFGQEVKYMRRVLIYGSQSDSIPAPSPIWMADLVGNYEPGQVAVVDVASSFPDGFALYELVKSNQVLSRQWIELSPKRTKIRVPIQESHRGGLRVNVHMLHEGETYSQTSSIDVPWTNKELQIELATFRNKLEPGAKEEWLLKIRGDKGQQVAAELLAGLYDASLDEFQPHEWSLVLPSTQSTWYNRSWEVPQSRYMSIACIVTPYRGPSNMPDFNTYDACTCPCSCPSPPINCMAAGPTGRRLS